MIQIHALTSHYVLGTAKKAALFVAVAARFVARLKGRWSDGNDGLERRSDGFFSIVRVYSER
jgi:hypothetical protein